MSAFRGINLSDSIAALALRRPIVGVPISYARWNTGSLTYGAFDPLFEWRAHGSVAAMVAFGIC